MSSRGPSAPTRTFSAISSAGSSSERSYDDAAMLTASKYENPAPKRTRSSSDGIRNVNTRLRMLFRRGAGSLIFRFPHVPKPAHCANPYSGSFHFCSKARYVHLDRIGGQRIFVARQLLCNLLFTEDTPGTGQEEFE